MILRRLCSCICTDKNDEIRVMLCTATRGGYHLSVIGSISIHLSVGRGVLRAFDQKEIKDIYHHTTLEVEGILNPIVITQHTLRRLP